MKNTLRICLLCLAVCLSSVTGAFADTYVNTSVDNKTAVITVSGKIDGEKNSVAGIYVLQGDVNSLEGIIPQNSKAYINHAEQVETDENGEFSFDYKLVGEAGTYKVFMSNFDGTKKADTKFAYISYDEIENHIKTIEKNRDPENKNNDLALRISEIKKILSKELVLNAFGILESEFPGELKLQDIDDEIYGYIAQSEKECKEKDDIKSAVYSSLVTKLFNASEKEDYDELFEECSKVLNTNEKIYEIYKSSEDIKNTVNNMLSNYTFKSSDEVSNALTECIVLNKYKSMTHYSEFMLLVEETANAMGLDLDAYNKIKSPYEPANVDKAMLACKNTINTLEELQNEFKEQIETELARNVDSGNSGSGSGKGSSSKGSSGVSLGGSIGLGTEVLSGYKAAFTDIAGVEWARTAIDTLTEKGIISGYGDGTYRPHNSIMREEAVKIIIASFAFYDKNAVSDFTDVSSSEWYSGYVASAQKLGIISGMGDGTFGVGKSISRQDMAVIINNISTVFGNPYQKTREYIGFADEENISAYAKDAVVNLYCAGILNGNDLNEFNPTSSLTRAEMAKIMASVLDITE